MFCGFGAVVLLVLLINSNVIQTRKETLQETQADLQQEELRLQLSRKHQEKLLKELTDLEKEGHHLNRQKNNLVADIAKLNKSITADTSPESNKIKIEALQQELLALEKEKSLLESEIMEERKVDRKVRRFEGIGNRQYLTGLKLGGSRVLLLIDTSASMLDRKIVDIIRRKVRDADARRSAPKWQRALATVNWLIANLPATSSIQLYGFNTNITQFTPQGKKEWIKVTDTPRIDSMVQQLQATPPNNGTNLEQVFRKIKEITPKPDNIILLTDGLPTQGRGGTRAKTITGEQRVKLFQKAITHLSTSIPINIILFPIEGDPMASVLFWKLAIETKGSFFTPTQDWP